MLTIALWILASALRPAVALVGLVLALVLRGVYVASRKWHDPGRRFLSPWLFALAAGCTALSLAGSLAGENDETDQSAVERGVAQEEQATCTDLILAEFDTIPPAERAFSRRDFRTYGEHFCEEAIRRNLFESARFEANREEIQALQQEVLDELLSSGEIQRRP